jgi:hypothetical protein
MIRFFKYEYSRVFQGIDSQTWNRRRNGKIEVSVAGIENSKPLTITEENTFTCMDDGDCMETDVLVDIDQRFPWVDPSTVKIKRRKE